MNAKGKPTPFSCAIVSAGIKGWLLSEVSVHRSSIKLGIYNGGIA
jgi:methyl coenzyme M reductase alpha subunit